MKFKFQVDFGYWAIPFGFGFEEGYLWIGVLCLNLDIAWRENIKL